MMVIQQKCVQCATVFPSYVAFLADMITDGSMPNTEDYEHYTMDGCTYCHKALSFDKSNDSLFTPIILS